MSRLLTRWFITTLAIMMVPHLITGITVEGLGTALAAAAILALLNVLVRPILVFFTLPLTIVSLGFFLLVINAFIFQIAGKLVEGFQVDTFTSAFLGALVVSFVSWVMSFASDASPRTRIVKVRHAVREPMIDLNRERQGHNS